MRVIRWVVLIVAIFGDLPCPDGRRQRASPSNPARSIAVSAKLVPSGEHLYKQFCSACHGADAKGQGPAAASLKTPPPDLTTLAKRHTGKFPEEYVTSVLLFGPGTTAHGASDMPTWGPVFEYLDKHDEAAVRQRIKNLTNYLKSVQEN